MTIDQQQSIISFIFSEKKYNEKDELMNWLKAESALRVDGCNFVQISPISKIIISVSRKVNFE